MYAFENPDKIESKTDWVSWVFRLKSNPDKKYALEFVEGWKGGKIMILGAIPWVGSFLTALIWSACGGDIQTAFSVASYILTASGSMCTVFRTVNHALIGVRYTCVARDPEYLGGMKRYVKCI